MLDPLSALSVAGNVIQFVEFGTRLVSTSLQLYRTKNFISHADLREKASDMYKLSSVMQEQLKATEGFPKANAFLAPQAGNVALWNDTQYMSMLTRAVDRCASCAADLLAATETSNVQGSHPKWESFRIALKAIMGETKVRALAQQLSEAERSMQLFLVLYIRSVGICALHTNTDFS